MEVVSQHHNALGGGHVLHVLREYDHIDLVRLQQLVQAVYSAQVGRHALTGGGVQIADILHRCTAALFDHIAEKAVCQLPAADDQRPGHNVVLAHVGIGDLVKRHALEVEHNDRQQVIIRQQQAGKLADAEHIKCGCHQRQAHQAGQRNEEKLLYAVAQMQCAVAAQHGVAAHDDQRIQRRDGQERPDIPHKEPAAKGRIAAQPTRKNKGCDEQQKLESGIAKPHEFGFVIVHAGPPCPGC